MMIHGQKIDRPTIEALAVFAWFLMDAAWFLEWNFAVHVIGGLAWLLMFFITLSAETAKDRFSCLTDLSWLLANFVWAAGDITGNVKIKPLVFYSFVFGLIFFACGWIATGQVPRLIRSRFLTPPESLQKKSPQ